MGIEELEFWKLRITRKRNDLVSVHSIILKRTTENVHEEVTKTEKLNELSKRIKSLETFYKRIIK